MKKKHPRLLVASVADVFDMPCRLESDVSQCPKLVVILVGSGCACVVVNVIPLELELQILVRTRLQTK